MTLNHLSLYSGIGAKDLAAHWAGMRTVAMCDIDPFCQKVLRKNFPGVPIFNSDEEVTVEALRALGIDRVDVVSGGFPCQAWSVAGRRGGENDPRHRWPEMRRVIRDVQPTWVFGENVRGLVSGGGLDAVCDDLEALGYEVWPVILPTGAAVGAPHKRERVFIVAYKQRRPDFQKLYQREYFRLWSAARTLADTDSERLARAEPQRRNIGIDPQPGSGDSAGQGEGPTATQPRLGGDADGVPGGMDRPFYRWPAGRGEAQFDWEPPRLTQRKDLRRERIKALGNSAVPQAIYPFFAAMVAVSEGGFDAGVLDAVRERMDVLAQ